ncbi:TolA-binding protein [Sporosarcina sp. JAI121]|nr:TolA-binding protein [Sporosarcina sp. JAI121]
MGIGFIRHAIPTAEGVPGTYTPAFPGFVQAENQGREVWNVGTLEKDIKRMEIQIEQLISIIANQNSRLNRIEDVERQKRLKNIRMIPLAERG